MAGYLAFRGVVWMVEYAAKTLVWTINFLSVFKKQKTEVFENGLVWTEPNIGHEAVIARTTEKLKTCRKLELTISI